MIFKRFEAFFIHINIPGVPKNKFPNLSCYISKSSCYLTNVIKEMYYTMPHLDMSICLGEGGVTCHLSEKLVPISP